MKQPNPNPKNALPIKKYPKKMFKRSDTVSEYMDDESTRRKKPRKPTPKRTPHTTPAERQTLERRPLPNGRATPRDKRILPRELPSRRQGPARKIPRDELTLPSRRQEPARRTPRDEPRRIPREKQTLEYNMPKKMPSIRKPKFMTTDSLNTSMYAGPFRKPKNLTDSLGTASAVARKYRKLGSK